MEHSLQINFNLRESKINIKGKAPINMRITLDGKRIELSTHRNISPDIWDRNTGYAKGDSRDTINLNDYLDCLKAKLLKQYNILESLNQPVTLETIKKGLNGNSDSSYKLIEAFDHHNEQFKLKVGTDYSNLTYKHYKATLATIEAFHAQTSLLQYLPLMQKFSLSLHMAKFEVAAQPEPYILVRS